MEKEKAGFRQVGGWRRDFLFYFVEASYNKGESGRWKSEPRYLACL